MTLLAWDFKKHHEQRHVRDFIDCITIEGTVMAGCQTYHDMSTTVLKIGGLGQHRGVVNVLMKGWKEGAQSTTMAHGVSWQCRTHIVKTPIHD